MRKFEIRAGSSDWQLREIGNGADLIIIKTPHLKDPTDDNGPVVAALVRVAGDLLVAEYDAEAHINTARAQAEALGQQLGKAHERAAQAPLNVGVIDPLAFPPGLLAGVDKGRMVSSGDRLPCAKCGNEVIAGQPCLNCQINEEIAKENAPGGQ